jgi:hypothetical protein
MVSRVCTVAGTWSWRPIKIEIAHRYHQKYVAD